MFSLKYGTVPLVRVTGGLADTVVDATEETVANGTATGFSFVAYESKALVDTIERALAAFADAGLWGKLVAAGMAQDWSWTRSARDYQRVYRETIEKKKRRT
jgi:starch synthase